ncbi:MULTISPECIES: hypothetical protein [unclassified Mesorhizobium]|uniref:hypothetical protein n=1 Tax=unclassified Mesorhizobium TaxID=325217 RepID=UPI0015E486E9|nr:MULTISPECIES: hypothetical protein [unclassified Mesorhizobium]UCI32716.1 hypothetical protein FJW03_04500 [Mesorhizobium sp. B4-1-4]
MKLKYFRRVSTSILSALLLFAASGASTAGSLAGRVGDKHFPPTLSGDPKSPCTKAYKAYVAASGHSAYATTPYSRVVSLYILCGARLNAPSRKVAEELAMKSCVATRAHYKVTNGGACEIAASK